MKLSGLGPRTTKLYARNVLIMAGSVLVFFVVLFGVRALGYEKLAFWLGLPFFVTGFLSGLGLWGVGPFKVGFFEAVVADEEEAKKKYVYKQPWER